MNINSLMANLIIPLSMIIIGIIFINCPVVSDLPQKINEIWANKKKYYFVTWIVIGATLTVWVIFNNILRIMSSNNVSFILSIVLLLLMSVPTPFMEVKLKNK